MAARKITPTWNERHFDKDEIIVSKTDLKGRLTYANDVFLDIAGYTEDEVLGEQHSIIRHPYMPRCIFRLLWDKITQGEEVFAYVINMCKNGDHYWVFAHITPTLDQNNKIIGYHSNRRVPEADSIEHVKKLYDRLREEEEKHSDRRRGLDASYDLLCGLLQENKMEYPEFVWTI